MAKEEKAKKVLERTYNIPLRKQFLKVPRFRRAKKAISAVRIFLEQHMKSSVIKLGRQLNMAVWENGIKNPPHHVKVNAIKYDNGEVKAELIGFDVYEKKEESEKPKKKTEAPAPKEETKKVAEKPVEKKEEEPAAKKEEKPEVKEAAEESKKEKKEDSAEKPKA